MSDLTSATRNARPAAVAARAARPVYETRTGVSNLPPSATDVGLFAHLTESPLVGDVVTTHANLVNAYQAAALALDAHTFAEGQAIEDDALALRAALRKSATAADTGTPAADAWTAQAASLLRRFNGLGDAVADAYVEMIGVLAIHADDLAAIHAADAASARSRLEILLVKAAAEVDLIDTATNAETTLAQVITNGSGLRIKPGRGAVALVSEGHVFQSLTARDLLGRISGYRAPVEAEPVAVVVFSDGLDKPARRRR